MATAEELLATVGNEENYIVIDSDLRTMTFPASVKNIGVENDKDVHKLNFMMPRYFSEYDLSTFNIRINYLNAQGDGDMYVVTDPTVEDDAIYFTWLVGRHACLYKGAVTFIVCLKLADGEGDVAQEFNTTLASLQVLPGLETEPAILENDYDIIEQLLLTVQDTNDKIKAVLDSGLTPEEITNFVTESKTLSARMDEFTKLPDGSTTGDAELTDIRVGADGTVYNNAGGAVRGQVSDLKSAFDDVSEPFYGKNRFNKNDRTDGYVLLEDGTPYATSGWSISNYCYVGDFETVICSVLNASNVRNKLSLAYACTYTADKTFIERIGTLVTTPASIDENVAYIRFCYENTNLDKDIMLEGGSIITNYVEYYETTSVKTDKTLTSEYLPANAKAVSEKIKNAKDVIDYESVSLTLTGSKYLNAITGEITSGGSDNNKVSDYIEVTPNGRVMITTEHFWAQGMYAFYDENKTFITGTGANTGGTVTVIYNKIVNVPVNAHYLVIGFLYQASMPSPYVFNGIEQSGRLSEIWKDKKWACIGDSLTEYNGKTSMHYFDFVACATGIEIVNMGVSGSGYAKLTDNFMTRVLNVPTDCDVVTIFGSGNDSSVGLDLGTASDSGTSTLGGVINTTLDNLFSIMPVCNVGLVTPTPWQGNMPYDNGWMESYSNLIVEICKLRSIPCLDLFHCSNLNPNSSDVRSAAYSKDNGGGVHPDETGHKMIAPRFKAFLSSLLI